MTPFWSRWHPLPRFIMTLVSMPLLWVVIAGGGIMFGLLLLLMYILAAVLYPIAHVWWGMRDHRESSNNPRERGCP